MDFSLLFLGSGTSCGVPMIGCDCAVCRSADPRNRRRRAGVYVSAGNVRVLVDVSPDFRMQALDHDIRRADALLVTHAHFDHLFGLDDIRRLNTIQNAVIPVYASPEALADIRRIYDYIFRPNPLGTYRPKLELLPSDAPFEIRDYATGEASGLRVTPFEVVHGGGRTQGFRFDFQGRSLAYMPDFHEVANPDEPALRDLDVLVLDMLRYTPHPTHASFPESLAVVDRFRPRRAFFTHICHDVDHATLCEELHKMGRDWIRPAYDGLEIQIPG